MAKNKIRVYPGQLLKEESGIQVWEVSTETGYGGIGGFDVVMAAFNRCSVAVRVSRGPAFNDGPMPEQSQIALSRDDFEVLIASYHAFQRAEKKNGSAVVPASDDFYRFIDSDDMP